MDIKIITADDFHGRKKGTFGSSTIRGYWLVNRWNELDYFKQGSKADVMIYQKVFWKWHMKDFNGIKILDLCDPEWMKGEMQIKELSLLVDAITTSTETLANVIKKWVDIPVVHIPDRVDLKMFTKPKNHEGRARNVVWYGYQANGDIIVPQLLPSLFKRGLSLHIVSNAELRITDDNGVPITFSKYEYETAYDIIKQSDICINYNPMTTNFKFKSQNKTLIAWALGLPVANTIEDLDKFMEAEERNKEIKKRWKELEDKHDIKYSVKQYKDLINKICTKKKKN